MTVSEASYGSGCLTFDATKVLPCRLIAWLQPSTDVSLNDTALFVRQCGRKLVATSRFHAMARGDVAEAKATQKETANRWFKNLPLQSDLLPPDKNILARHVSGLTVAFCVTTRRSP